MGKKERKKGVELKWRDFLEDILSYFRGRIFFSNEAFKPHVYFFYFLIISSLFKCFMANIIYGKALSRCVYKQYFPTFGPSFII